MGLVAVGIVILIFVSVMAKVGGIFGKKAENAAKGNFEMLARALQTLIDSDKEFDYRELSALNIPSKFVLVGFDSEWHGNGNPDKADACSRWGYDTIEKPKVCEDKGCICIYDKDPKVEKIVNCIKLSSKSKLYISGPADEIYNIPKGCGGKPYDNDCLNQGNKKEVNMVGEDISYEYFVIYGKKCDESIWKTRPIYIEKYVNDVATYLFVGIKDINSVPEFIVSREKLKAQAEATS